MSWETPDVLITAYISQDMSERLRTEIYRQDISKSKLISDALELYFRDIENKSWGR